MPGLQAKGPNSGDGGNRTHAPFPTWPSRIRAAICWPFRRLFALVFGRILPPGDM